MDEEPLLEFAVGPGVRRVAAVPELGRDAALRALVVFFAGEPALRLDVLLALLRAVVAALREPLLALRALLFGFAAARLVCF